MARPRVFVSSTFYDLKHIRASLEVFIESLGFDAVLFEKGDISFSPDQVLDESCYREAANADIFVLIIGGRYGSAASNSAFDKQETQLSIYESITRKEFEAAQSEDVPTFILLDNAVAAEYRIYPRNRENKSVVYAHVDSEGIFRLIESVFERSKNNPVFNFERATQIESWLREQWSGLFRELLRSRSQQRQLAALNSQITELKSINDTLKTYLEVLLKSVEPKTSGGIISGEEGKLKQVRLQLVIETNGFYRYPTEKNGVSQEDAIAIFEKPSSVDEAIAMVVEAINPDGSASNKGTILRRNPMAQKDYNQARMMLDLPTLPFRNTFEGRPIVEESEGATRQAMPTEKSKPNQE